MGLEIDQKSIPEGMKTCKRTREQNKAYWRRLKPSGARLWLEWVGYGGVSPRARTGVATRRGLHPTPKGQFSRHTQTHLGLGKWQWAKARARALAVWTWARARAMAVWTLTLTHAVARERGGG